MEEVVEKPVKKVVKKKVAKKTGSIPVSSKIAISQLEDLRMQILMMAVHRSQVLSKGLDAKAIYHYAKKDLNYLYEANGVEVK